ncbi:MAG TPA: tRNA/rRNA methyltransferase [Bacteroidales bacterium]|nr:tRNA/rRNA methyltransferase [Bacteroidales bacterium]
MKTAFILVEPAVAGNIGAAARAIKVMGFTELWLVNPANHLANEARWLAHASTEILDNARIFDSLEEAAAETDLLIATTAKARNSNQDYINADNLQHFIKQKENTVETLGIVFGREESGLNSDEMKLCDAATTLNMATTYPSLNLSQAVMLFAYLLSKNQQTIPEKDEQANEKGFRMMKENVIRLLQDIGYNDTHPILQRMKERLSFLSGKDMNLIHSAVSKINKKLLKDRD